MISGQLKSLYRRTLTEAVSVRRYSGTGSGRTLVDYACHAQVVGYQPHELVGPILQGDRKAIILASDLVDAGFPLPVRNTDKLVVRGVELQIIGADDSTRRIDGVLIAVECQVRG